MRSSPEGSDGCKVLASIVWHLLHQRRDEKLRGRSEQDRVSIRLRLRHEGRGDCSPAPARLSMRKRCPRRVESHSETIRAIVSVLPPAAYGTMTLTGRSGHAKAAGADINVASASVTKGNIRAGLAAIAAPRQRGPQTMVNMTTPRYRTPRRWRQAFRAHALFMLVRHVSKLGDDARSRSLSARAAIKPGWPRHFQSQSKLPIAKSPLSDHPGAN